MKKLIFLLIILTTFMNVSFASFPVADTLETKVDLLQTEEIKQYHYSLQQMGKKTTFTIIFLDGKNWKILLI